jgi:phosphoribosylformimino-5-aminoimidazole carboxamide ribotide isomerase
MAITDPEKFEQVCEQFPGAVVLAIDARDGMVATHGWREVSSLRAEDVLQNVCHLPLAAVQYTDISKDGTLEGPNLVAIREMAQRCPFPFVAAGGIGSLDDIRRLRKLDREIGGRIWGVILGQALYRGALSLKEAFQAVYADGLHPAG